MTRSITAAHAALFAAFLFAPACHAVMYKWIDETGSVTYSNAPPANPEQARNVTTLGHISPDLGKREPALETAPQPAGAKAASSPSVGVSAPPAAGSDPPYGLTTHDASHPEAAAPATTPRAGARRRRAEAVRDPCLRSPDPQCHQRNRDKYHPYLGYAPGTLAPSAVGAASTAGAGGAVGGRIVITPGR